MSDRELNALVERIQGGEDMTAEQIDAIMAAKAAAFSAWCDAQVEARRRAEEEHKIFARVAKIRSRAFWWLHD